MARRHEPKLTRVFVLGNAGIDLSLTLPRLPQPGETLVAEAVARAPGGKGLNQAVVAARAGATVLFAAPVGADADGDAVAAALANEPFLALHLHRGEQRTDQSILMVAPGGENSIVTAGARAAAMAPDIAARFVAGMTEGDILLMQGNLSLPATRRAMEAARERGGRVMLNAAPLRWSVSGLLSLCDVVVVNEVEARGITGSAGGAAAAALRAAGVGLALVTLGAAGCVVADAAGITAVPGLRVDAVDTTGAGDTFCGVLASRFAAGEEWPVAVQAAQRAAAITVTRRGAFAALPTMSELAAILV
jgi:ribokinase